ncbi:S-adenosylmethionine synthetase [Segatella oulorum]|uniref:S-adenosylmethionine synthetase n=1 Tax=Segatella oulorum TaxID=28136 RepID=UPI0028E8F4CF|nr:S-adenosylmethionine synthetase [Segatella oulorum]
MNENLLDKVSTEKIEALVNALDAVIGDMRNVEESQLVRFRDNAYYTCLSLTDMILTALKRRVNGIQGE